MPELKNVCNSRMENYRERKLGFHGYKIKKWIFKVLLFSENQVAYLIFVVDYLVGKSVKIFWLTCSAYEMFWGNVEAMTVTPLLA